MQKLLLLACFLLNHALSYILTVEAPSRSKRWGQLTNRQGQFFLDLTQHSSESGHRTWQIIKVDHISWLLQHTISSVVPMTQQVKLWSVQDQEFRLLIRLFNLWASGTRPPAYFCLDFHISLHSSIVQDPSLPHNAPHPSAETLMQCLL